MNRIVSFFTRKLGLKLLALILALVVFYGVRGSIRGNRSGDDGRNFFMKGTQNAAEAR